MKKNQFVGLSIWQTVGLLLSLAGPFSALAGLEVDSPSTLLALPVAVADTYSVATGTTLTVSAENGVLNNDYDPDGDTLTATLVGAGTAFGDLTLNPDGSFVYVPNVNYIGPDHFVYKAYDGSEYSTPVTVTINVVTEGQTPPVAVDDTYMIDFNTTLTVDALSGVLSNDYDDDGDALTAELVGAGTAFGILTLNPDGSFVYLPNLGYIGSDRFSYQASDGLFTSNIVTVTINVVAEGQTPPVAVADTYTTVFETTLTVNAASGVLANDSDPDGDELTAQLVSGTAQGSLMLNPDGSFEYLPSLDFAGTDRFVYQAFDGLFTSPSVMVTINVNPVTIYIPLVTK
jgi:hypothetical protein